MRADEYVIEDDALGREQLHDERLGGFKIGPRERVGAEPVLVADHDEAIAVP